METKLLWKSLASLMGAIFLCGLPVTAQTISVDFTGMTPHLGQKLEARLISKKSLQEVDRAIISSISSTTFSVVLEGVVWESYYVDFYADLNGNGVYDAPPIDHAWRIDFFLLDSISSGTTNVPFAHNTSFDEIGWMYELTLALSDMTPHLGQKLEARLLDVNQNMKEVSRQSVSSVTATSFNLTFPGITIGNSYYLDFYADLNGNGVYDAPPVDHAWRMNLANLMGDSTVNFVHNTDFTDIDWRYLLTIDIVNISPHTGQMFELRVVDTDDDSEVGRMKRTIPIMPPVLSVVMPVVQVGHSYEVDFYADLNENGIYNAPPVDHAWRETVSNLAGNTTISFTHNLTFTDIEWNYLFTFNAKGMTPHLGQLFELKVVDTVANLEIGRVRLDSIETVDFMVQVPGLEIGNIYHVDYYADLNNNGSYNAPPVDHAWRDQFTDVDGDTVFTFFHNISFTDIMWNLGIIEIVEGSGITIFPNPFSHTIYLSGGNDYEFVKIELYNSLGQNVYLSSGDKIGDIIEINDLGKLSPGVYLLKISDQNNAYIYRVIKN